MRKIKDKSKKYKVFFFTLCTLIFLLGGNAFAQDSTKVTDMPADTSPAAAGAFYYVESSTDKHITWSTIMAAIRDSIQNNTFWGVSITGAAFNAGSNGTVLFSDTTLFGHTVYPSTTDIYSLGAASKRWYRVTAVRMYAENFIITNSEQNDSALITLDDSLMSISRDVAVNGKLTTTDDSDFGGDISLDSSYVYNNTTYGVYKYAIANVADSILTLQDTCAVIDFVLPGNVTNMEKIVFATGQGRGGGTVIRIINQDPSNTIFIEDEAPTDGNIFLSADFTMGVLDYLELMYFYSDDAGWVWTEIGRSDN